MVYVQALYLCEATFCRSKLGGSFFTSQRRFIASALQSLDEGGIQLSAHVSMPRATVLLHHRALGSWSFPFAPEKHTVSGFTQARLEFCHPKCITWVPNSISCAWVTT